MNSHFSTNRLASCTGQDHHLPAEAPEIVGPAAPGKAHPGLLVVIAHHRWSSGCRTCRSGRRPERCSPHSPAGRSPMMLPWWRPSPPCGWPCESPTEMGISGSSGPTPPASNMIDRFGDRSFWASMAAAQGAPVPTASAAPSSSSLDATQIISSMGLYASRHFACLLVQQVLDGPEPVASSMPPFLSMYSKWSLQS
jgi:hypothetical protein